jgi:hypothetical protein
MDEEMRQYLEGMMRHINDQFERVLEGIKNVRTDLDINRPGHHTRSCGPGDVRQRNIVTAREQIGRRHTKAALVNVIHQPLIYGHTHATKSKTALASLRIVRECGYAAEGEPAATRAKMREHCHKENARLVESYEAAEKRK